MSVTPLFFEELKALASDVQSFQLEFSSDDSDVDWATIGSLRHLAKRFVRTCQLIDDSRLNRLVAEVNTDIDFPTDASDLHALLMPAAAYVQELPSHAVQTQHRPTIYFIELSLIRKLESSTDPEFDAKKLVQFCNEINSCYINQNIIATALLIRAVLNHVPPVFGYDTFAQVVNHSGRSLKAVLKSLESQARPIADLHSHIKIRKSEPLPTYSQLDPFRPAFEILLQEVASRFKECAE